MVFERYVCKIAMIGIQISPISFIDEGVPGCLEVLQQRVGINTLLIGTVSWLSNRCWAMPWRHGCASGIPPLLAGGRQPKQVVSLEKHYV
jgi:hypothetical protein